MRRRRWWLPPLRWIVIDRVCTISYIVTVITWTMKYIFIVAATIKRERRKMTFDEYKKRKEEESEEKTFRTSMDDTTKGYCCCRMFYWYSAPVNHMVSFASASQWEVGKVCDKKREKNWSYPLKKLVQCCLLFPSTATADIHSLLSTINIE